ncbi:MAG: hypothetical protein RL169_570, partial [Armatimonadota bacterium]
FKDQAASPMTVLMAITSGVRIDDSTVWMGKEKTREMGNESTSRAVLLTRLVGCIRLRIGVDTVLAVVFH